VCEEEADLQTNFIVLPVSILFEFFSKTFFEPIKVSVFEFGFALFEHSTIEIHYHSTWNLKRHSRKQNKMFHIKQIFLRWQTVCMWVSVVCACVMLCCAKKFGAKWEQCFTFTFILVLISFATLNTLHTSSSKRQDTTQMPSRYSKKPDNPTKCTI
jgi:hypothetical protein